MKMTLLNHNQHSKKDTYIPTLTFQFSLTDLFVSAICFLNIKR